ncbi:hypothetical protein ACFY64_03645 [Streptomyces collinus]|uniref:hypothetical protein n=1 Tax=Streptomyces collinus TaxID=42684 RepID=UPI0036C73C96
MERGPLTHGWAEQRWTLARIKMVIDRLFHVSYTVQVHVSYTVQVHVSYTVQGTWRLLRRHSWSWR